MITKRGFIFARQLFLWEVYIYIVYGDEGIIYNIVPTQVDKNVR